jgi:hypothetical protein
MSTTAVREQVKELRWLIEELGQELDTLATTSYPRVHCFLMRNLATRIARVAMQVQRHLAEQLPEKQSLSDEVRLVEQSA